MMQANRLSWALLILYAAVEIIPALLPDAIPLPVAASIITFLPFIFAFVHGLQTYTARSFAVFVVVCFVVSNAMENLSIMTGFSVRSLLLHGDPGSEAVPRPHSDLRGLFRDGLRVVDRRARDPLGL